MRKLSRKEILSPFIFWQTAYTAFPTFVLHAYLHNMFSQNMCKSQLRTVKLCWHVSYYKVFKKYIWLLYPDMTAWCTKKMHALRATSNAPGCHHFFYLQMHDDQVDFFLVLNKWWHLRGYAYFHCNYVGLYNQLNWTVCIFVEKTTVLLPGLCNFLDAHKNMHTPALKMP